MSTFQKIFMILALSCAVFSGTAVDRAEALPLNLYFSYSGTNGTSATGSILFDSAYLDNPSFGTQYIAFPIDPAVTSLTITYAGFANPVYNTTFYLSDFAGMNWDTHNTTLDFSQNLLGQTTYDPFDNPDGLWGPGGQGEFSLFSVNPGNPLFPQYNDYFALNYGGEVFTMDSATSVPEPSTFILLGSGLCGVILLRKRFRKS